MTPPRKYCSYCRSSKPALGFKDIRDKGGRLRNRKCADCSAMKHKPVAERDAIAQKQRVARKVHEAHRMGELVKQREKTSEQHNDHKQEGGR